MVKPIDLDEFFEAQQERLNISDSDWEQYEERIYQDRKRKRTIENQPKSLTLGSECNNTVETKNPADSHSLLPDSIHSYKKRKVSQTAKSSDTIGPNPRSPPTVALPYPDRASPFPQDHRVTSSSPGEPPTTSRKHIAPTSVDAIQASVSSSSNITSPTITPCQGLNSAFPDGIETGRSSGESSSGVAVGKRARVQPPKSQLKAKDQGTGRNNKSKKTKMSADHLPKKVTLSAKQEAEKSKRAQDDQEKLMTPLQYAAILKDKWRARVSNTPPERLFLQNKVIFLVFEEKNKSTKDTRIKLDIIARSGGQVATHYDPEVVTHIIPGGSTITLKKTLRALGLNSLFEIPSNVHTVEWDWIVSGLSNGMPDSEIMHESYKQRIAQKYSKRQEWSDIKGKSKAGWSTTNEHSVIEDFASVYDSQENDIPQDGTSSFLKSNEEASTLRVQNEQNEDPLLPFYAKAREEAETADSLGEPHVGIRTLPDNSMTSKLKGFQCDTKGTHLQGVSPNWDVIEKLAELREMHRDNGTNDDKWRVLGYQKAIGSLKAYPSRIKSREEALKLRGISDKTADKIMEIIRTGELQRIKYTKTEDLKVMRLFSGIYGVGSSTARKWFHQGLKSLDDIKRAVQNGTHKLSAAQEIGLKFYEDINDRMPRKEAEDIFLKIQSVALGLDAKLSLQIMGSFRRGKETCGDIDILLTRNTDDGRTHAGILVRLYNLLHKQGVLTEDLALPEDWEALEATYRGLCRKDGESRRRRIDILCIPYECRGAAQIYYTGDDIFNRSIRLKANKMNMSLNQRGLFQEVIRDPQDRTKKLCAGSLLCSDSEKKIFELLGVPWQEAHERVRGG